MPQDVTERLEYGVLDCLYVPLSFARAGLGRPLETNRNTTCTIAKSSAVTSSGG